MWYFRRGEAPALLGGPTFVGGNLVHVNPTGERWADRADRAFLLPPCRCR